MSRPGKLTLALALAHASLAAAAQEDRLAPDRALLERADAARTIGSATAEATIDEFLDFACPDCRDFHAGSADSLRALVASEDVLFTLRMYPIPRLMRGFQAAEAALCSAAFRGRPGFLGMMEQLFRNQDAWRRELDPTPMFETYAERIGVPLADYRACVARDAMAPLIVADIRMARDIGVEGTPTFVFNKRGEFTGDQKFYGIQSIARFRESLRKVKER